MSQAIQWSRGLTFDLDPDAKLLYNIDLSDWFPVEWEVVSVVLIYDNTEITVPYEALDAAEKQLSFKVSDVINNGKKIPITMRITVTNGVLEQVDDRTIFFRAKDF